MFLSIVCLPLGAWEDEFCGLGQSHYLLILWPS